MRLINVKTLKLEKFLDNQLPPYAILSHTWKDGEELTLRDIEEGKTDKPGIGSIKLQRSCKQAEKDGYGYIWNDTCCIDKTDSVELGEAINSMFRWYKKAGICYAYLLDVPGDDNPRKLGSEFRKSRWFKRGWTLQELLAPQRLQFYSSDWRRLGTKGELCNIIEGVTGISRLFLLGIEQLGNASVAQRMSWAAQRETTRGEDIAYCLLGIFGVAIPMIYGEGGEQAFFRLQEQIMRTTRDDSILAWGLSLTEPISNDASEVIPGRILATTPSDFANCKHITSREQSSSPMHSLEISGGSLRVYISLLTTPTGKTIGLLKCGHEHEPQNAVGVPLSNTMSTSSDEYARPRGSHSVLLPVATTNTLTKLIYIKNDSQIEMSADANKRYWLYNDEFADINLSLIDVSPRSCWDKERSLIVSTMESQSSARCRILARFRHTEEGSPDFVIVLEIEHQKSDVEPQCYIMICSRDTSLADLAENLRYMPRHISWWRSASNGILNMRLICQSVAWQPIIHIRPDVVPSLQEATFDATLELQKLGLRLEFAKLMEEEGQTNVEHRDVEQKVMEESTRLEQTDRELEVVEDELARLTKKMKTLMECRKNGAQEIVRLNAIQTEIKKRQEDIFTRQLYIQRQWNGIRHGDNDNGDGYEPEEIDRKTLLRWAAENGHDGTVKLLLQNGADLEAAGDDREASLHLAAGEGHVEVVPGTDLKAAGDDGEASLHRAAGDRHVGVVQGVDPKAADENRETPLHRAAREGHLEVIQLLLNQGADVNAAGQNGETPLHWAAQEGHFEVVQLLLNQGADVNAAGQNGETPLHWAAQEGHFEVVQLLLNQGADLSAAGDNGETPLHRAARGGHLEVIQILLNQGADLKAVNQYGETPLHWASFGGHPEVIQLLLNQGANINTAGQHEWTPLHRAAREGHLEVVQQLLNQGANIKAVSQKGSTPLHWAAKSGHLEVVLLLLNQGADLKTINKYKMTPLLLAAKKGHLEIVRQLLERGADAKAKDTNGYTPLYWANKNGHLEIAQLLRDNGAETRWEKWSKIHRHK